ncbi:MAG: sigma-70 family RNA polymerase sigma factor [Tannerella sp.]|jgi:RNA polymerase sigma-70 factor (ECF subfamily)|nr:sigma-70 family RNA polymerase sigma factor [Tannerella sp.]
MSENETVIWNQFRNGDKEAFSTLFKSTSDRLYRYGMKFTDDDELVKDCIQDLFLKLYRHRTELPEIEHALFYLFKMLKNILIDALRHRERFVYLPPQELPFHVEFVLERDDDTEADEEIRERFEQVIALLSERQKEAIYLRYQAEMSYEEISQLLGINYQSARNLIHRAIEKIRSTMDLNTFLSLLY